MKLNKSTIIKMPFRAGGFTLIELIVVMLIIGIIAISVGPVSLNPKTFEAYVVRDHLLSSMRLVQQQAMQQTNRSVCHRFIIEERRFGSAGSCTTSTLPTVVHGDYASYTIRDSDVSITSTSGNIFTFDSMGRVDICSSGCVVSLSDGRDTAKLCLESQGYIHACD